MQRTSRYDPIQVSQWKRQLLDGSSELFTRSKQTKVNKVAQAKEAELFHQIGRLQMEIDAFYLARDGIPISHDRVQNLMPRMGLRAI
jgi:hypothetical protein